MPEPGGNAPQVRLILLRHAKSAYPEGIADHERPLSARGRREAGMAGAWLMRTQPSIDGVLCSSARRAGDTLQRSGIAAPVTIEPRLYGATAPDILAVLHDLPAGMATLLVIGHAPGLPESAAVLSGAESDPGAVAALVRGFPTSAVAVLTAPGPWSALRPGSTRLVAMHVPRD